MIINAKQTLAAMRLSNNKGENNSINPLPFTRDEKLDTKNG